MYFYLIDVGSLDLTGTESVLRVELNRILDELDDRFGFGIPELLPLIADLLLAVGRNESVPDDCRMLVKLLERRNFDVDMIESINYLTAVESFKNILFWKKLWIKKQNFKLQHITSK